MSILFQLELAAGAQQDQQIVDRLFSEHLPGGLCHLSHYPDLQWLVAYGWGSDAGILAFLTALYHHYEMQVAPLSNEQVHPFAGIVHRLTFIQVGTGSTEPLLASLQWIARRLGQSAHVPIILVEGAARTRIRRSAAIVLANGYRDLAERLKSMPPEFGPAHVHPKHGVMLASISAPRWEAIVDLDRQNLNVAQKLARKVCERDGGVPGVQAIARALPSASSSRLIIWCDAPDEKTERLVEKRLQQLAEEQNVQPASMQVLGLRPAELTALKQPVLAS